MLKSSPRSARIVAGVAAAAIAATVGIGVTMASAAGTVTATYVQTSNWGSGAEGKYTVVNGSAATISSWTIVFTMPSGTTLSSFWDADITSSGSTYTAKNKSWNGTLAPGSSVSFGFVTAGSGQPTSCTINGAPCGTGANPSPSASIAPSPSVSPSPSPSVSPSVSPSTSPTTSPSPSPSTTVNPGAKKVIGYFAEWGVYGRNFHVKNLHTSGSAAKLTHIMYAFGNVTNGQCAIGDSYAAYDKAYTAADSVDGVADTWDQTLRGNFNQLRKLKQMYPGLKVIWSFGGWTWSGGFGQAAQNATAFANSCYNLVEDPRWADVFDGIDIDWEYPNACGLSCDTSGFSSFKTLMQALRSRFGSSNLITAAITADGTTGGKIEQADYAGAAQYIDWYMPMTYDFFGAWAQTGPTAPHSALSCYSGMPISGFCTEQAIAKLRSLGVPASKLLIGIGFYGRGWTGVTQSTPGGSATGAAQGTYESGIEDYKVLRDSCPATGTIGGTAYAKCGDNWWSYDTPSTIAGKMTWAKNQGLAGAFFWELSGDTGNGELITAISNGLK